MENKTGKLAILIMAAGKGTRMRSDLPKVLHKLRDRAMIHYVVHTAKEMGADPIVVIIGHQKQRVIDELEEQSIQFAVQEPQLGTGHAVMCAMPVLGDFSGSVLILSGDVPLIKIATLQALWNQHRAAKARATVLTAFTEEPYGYGRIVRKTAGRVQAIVEERDATDEIRKIKEINSGIYIFESEELKRVLPMINDDNDQKEYYLTDAVRLLTDEGKTVAAFKGDFREAMGINTVAELEEATRLKP